MTARVFPDLKVGDPVTYVDGITLLVHARWGHHRDQYKSFADAYEIRQLGMAGDTPLAYVALADEGRTWCRGHVNERTELGAALLAGAALAAELV